MLETMMAHGQNGVILLVYQLRGKLMSYPKKVEELIEDFSMITNQNERTDMLIYYADRFKEVPSHIASRPFPEEYRVITCESQAYVWSEFREDGTMKFYFAVENPQGISAKAMACILDETISGETPRRNI